MHKACMKFYVCKKLRRRATEEDTEAFGHTNMHTCVLMDLHTHMKMHIVPPLHFNKYKIPCSFVIKVLSKLGSKGNPLHNPSAVNSHFHFHKATAKSHSVVKTKTLSCLESQ